MTREEEREEVARAIVDAVADSYAPPALAPESSRRLHIQMLLRDYGADLDELLDVAHGLWED